MSSKIILSIVIPAYNEQDNVIHLYKETKDVLDRLKRPYEIIFIDDGSSDKTYENLRTINSKDKNVKVIRFRKNFGQSAAMDAGFRAAIGEYIITMDADLQNDPKDIPAMLSKMDEDTDVICGWRHNRKDGFFKRFFSFFANILRRSLTKESIHDSGCSLRVYKKEAAKDLDLHGEMHRYIPAILLYKGYRIAEVKVNHRPRKHGKTKYGVARLLKGFLDLIVIKFWMQYSMRPIHLFGGFGVVFFAIGLVIAAYLTFMKVFYGMLLADRPLLLLAILFIIFGTILFMFGVLADIMIKTYYKGEKVYSVKTRLE